MKDAAQQWLADRASPPGMLACGLRRPDGKSDLPQRRSELSGGKNGKNPRASSRACAPLVSRTNSRRAGAPGRLSRAKSASSSGPTAGCSASSSAPNPTPRHGLDALVAGISRAPARQLTRLFAFPFSARRHLVRVELTAAEIRRAVRAALAEDIGGGDVTTLATVPAKRHNPSRSCAPANRSSSPDLNLPKSRSANFRRKSKLKNSSRDGQHVAAGEKLLKISGSARAILSAERVALNFVQRLSGVATLTAQFVDAVKGTARKFSTRAKPRPAGGGLKNTPSPAAAGKIIASACSTWC